MKTSDLFKLVVAVLISELVGVVGSLVTVPAISSWYIGIAKPALNPPSWVFGPVWTALFLLMGIAAFLVWKKGIKRKGVGVALLAFSVQLALNLLWSVFFFGFQNPGLAFVEIIFLWVAIVATMIFFARVSKPAAWLLVPYIIWVSFAGYLNWSIWKLNSVASVGCTMEALLCPDGSYVGRTGPQCEFSPCSSGTAGYKNISYEIDGSPILLRNGVSETESAPGSASKIVTRYFGEEIRADLDDNGMEDVSFIVFRSGGGSGTFYYVVAALMTAEGYKGTNAILIGDRIAPQDLYYRNGMIVVDYVDRKVGEAMTASPSVGVSKYLEVLGGRLVEVEK